jgi:hypothetical protein
VRELWPYHDSAIVFQEYGRSANRHSNINEEMTLLSILPGWVYALLWGSGLLAFFLMFFYGQRLGRPLTAEGFFGRAPLESVYAMAAALQKSSAYKECAGYYYRYHARQVALWDEQGKLGKAIDKLANEGAACKLMDDIDQKIKEYRNEGK